MEAAGAHAKRNRPHSTNTIRGAALSVLLDPRIFNFAIMSLYGLAVTRWLFAGNLWAAGYWSCALGLTIIITFGKTH